MPRATENDPLPYESARIDLRIAQLDDHFNRPLKWAARLGKAGAIAIALLAFTAHTALQPLQPLLLGFAAMCLSFGFILFARRKPWKAALIWILVATPALWIFLQLHH
jgi:hypothetical protein